MRVKILILGRSKLPYVEQGVKEYVKRIGRFLPADIHFIPDIKRTGNLKEDLIRKKEAEKVLRHIDRNDTLVLLDEKGKMLSSKGFAGFIRKRIMAGGRTVVFLIGGAYGVSPVIKERADFCLSLSRMTFSRQLARIVFLEQLYRALCIWKGHPYHHG